jgi:hypothetical protein
LHQAAAGVSSSVVLVDGVEEDTFVMSVSVVVMLVVRSEVALSTLSLTVTEIAVVSSTMASVDGVEEVSFAGVSVMSVSVVVMLVVRSEVALSTQCMTVVQPVVVSLTMALVDGSLLTMAPQGQKHSLVVNSEVGISTLPLAVVEISAVPVTTVLMDGVQEVTFPFISSSSKRNDQFPAEPAKSC